MGNRMPSRRRPPKRGTSPWSIFGLGVAAVVAVVLVGTAIVSARTASVDAVPEVMPTIDAPVDILNVAFVGDSYTGGTSLDSGEDARWPALLAAQLGFKADLTTRGGAGYVQATDSGVNFPVLATRIANDPEVVVVFGSRNDDEGYEAVREGAARTYATIFREHPDTKLLVVGPPWVSANTPAWLLEARDATRDAAAEAGATYVDPIAESWFNADGLIGSDGVNPTDAGHALIASKIYPAISALLA
jgi:lysophospholipase L1-like esterase